MKRLLFGLLTLIGAFLAAFAASRRESQADEEDAKAADLRRTQSLEAAAAHADKANALRKQAKAKKQLAEKRMEAAAQHEGTFADIAHRFNSGVRQRTD